MLTYAITESIENSFYYVSAALDGLPPHWRTREGYLTVEDAKAAHPRDWRKSSGLHAPNVVATAIEY